MTDSWIPEILGFWRDAGPQRWFEKDPAFDDAIRSRFLPAVHAAAEGGLARWSETPDGALALCLLLDQFPRNLFRGSAQAFETDPAALAVARAAIDRGFDDQVDPALRVFFYLPFMHSEDLADQERCCALYEASGNQDGLKWARLHRDIIARFGRYPHRNAVLDRPSTPQEERFLAEGGFSG